MERLQAPFTDIPGHELLLQATVSFCNVPNVHKQKKVNAKTALTNADCGVKVKKKETQKKKFRGKVLKQKLAAGHDRRARHGRRDRHRSEVGA